MEGRWCRFKIDLSILRVKFVESITEKKRI